MADAKISALTGATTPLGGTEVLPIVQSGSTKNVATNDLTVKNIRSNATTGILQIAGPTAAATRTMTVPDANFTAARTDTAQSFSGLQTFGGGVSSTNATLTSGGLAVTASEAYSELYSSGGIGSNARVRYRAVYSGGGSGYGGSFELETRTSSNVYNTGAFTVTDAGDVSTTGNLVIGTAGKGIDFTQDPNPAGMTSELLDDYEEGTWTPTIVMDTGTSTGGTFSGLYTKIGRQVTLTISANVGTVASSPQIEGFSNLPFTSVDESPLAVGTLRENANTGNMFQWRVNRNSTASIVARYDNNKVLANGDTFLGTVTYFV